MNGSARRMQERDATGPSDESGRRAPLYVAAGAYLLFVVYGSLVPLVWRPRPLGAAWRTFLNTPYLSLDAGSRADWVANILLYIPLAYLLSAAFAAGGRSGGGRLLRIGTVFVVCATLAVGVEFTQLFFPPRTVSLNDIAAEFIGSGLGIGMWLLWGGAVERLWTEMARGGTPAIRAAVAVYVLAYLAFGLFPYDFLVSAQEFAQKFAGGGFGLIIASETCERLSGCAGKLIAETVAVVPLGVLLSMALGKGARHVYRTAALSGLALGLTLEVAQLFLASGVSEGAALFTRAVGMLLGVALHRQVRVQRLADLRPHLLRLLVVVVPLYLLALMWANAWFSAAWVGIDKARAGIGEVHWLPFYYHYFTTETHALRSLLAGVAMYLPVGFGYWAWTLRRSHAAVRGTALIPALIAAPLAVAMEAGKLFVPGKHPDPTDVLIAMAAAAVAYLLARQMHRWALQGEPGPPAGQSDVPGVEARGPAPSTGTGRVALSLLLLCIAFVALVYYPLGGAWLALALASYAVVLRRYPGLCLPAVLALLPLLDFSPWTGWTLVNEFDLFMMVTLAVRLLRPRPDAAGAGLPGGARWAIGLLAVSFCASAMVGLLPLSPFDQNALVGYYSSYNSLRHLKGFGWALALLPLMIEEAGEQGRMDRRWVTGMLAGLCAVLAVVVWERAAFAALLDFAGEYRAEGTFPELHTGGGDVHAYLVMAIPFVVAWIGSRPSAFRVVAGTALFMLASYALAVTFARGGYVGYIGAVAVLVLALAIPWLRQRARNVGRLTAAAVLGLAGLAVVMPIVSGSFMQARLAGTQSEATTRIGHWARAVEMMDAGATTALFGMGLGSFPRTVLFKEHESASATFSYGRDGGIGFVRLGSGRPLFLGQRVSVSAGESYTVALDLRSPNPKASVAVSLCEKSQQQSFRCRELGFHLQDAAPRWEHHEASFGSEQVGTGTWLLRRPVVLGLANAQPGTVVDVANLRLLDGTGANLIANGDFSRGGARWFFSADDHLPWHIFNLWVQILFEQGWIGVVAIAVALGLSLTRIATGLWRGDLFGAAMFAALCGFLLVGVTESLFDGPRVTTLFFLLVLAGLLRPTGRGMAAHPHVAS